MPVQNCRTIALSTLLSAAAMAMAATAALAGDTSGMDQPAVEKCYGVAKVGKNDCKSGAHACAGQATQDGDQASFVEIPAGLCAKLAHSSSSEE